MTAFIGLDLAWTPGRDSGLCILEEREGAVSLELLEARPVTVPEMVALARSFPAAVLAIDAPLLVGDDRTGDRVLARAFGHAKASPYHTTRAFLERMNGMAGPNLGLALQAAGFSLDPADIARGHPAVAMEVFPHAAHVSLFRLPERILYKKGRLDVRRNGLQRLATLLQDLFAETLPAIQLPAACDAFAPAFSWDLPGKQLKAIEDKLDALICAYTAWHVVHFGVSGTTVFGEPSTGSIAVPHWPGEAAGKHSPRGG